MRTDEFVFDLPPELIAQEPAEPRDSARLMVLRFKSQKVEHRSVRDLPELLRRGDLLVVNNTRVMAARLFGKRPDTGGKVEALLVRPFTDTTWEVLFKPARQARPGRRVVFETHEGELAATVLGRDDGPVVLEFERAFDPATVGEMPLPPYIKGFHGDPERYQTVYSRDAASAAAPTAGLHFTPGLLEQLRAGGIDRAEVTLEVGPGTFRPVSVDDPHDHILHSEHVTVPADAAEAVARARNEQRRIVAVGTTVVRTLEHVSRERGAVEAYDGWTGLRILPGDRFQVVDALLTNFHLPKSTLLMLVSAMIGRTELLRIYAEAIRERYRFFSYGDAMLVIE